ncbi:hypothetical protein AB0F77_41380 [Streptomyces sp. NPDC026672]|uniref:hypothetical protein n=1 Tax=unclassified Streptomyces TaxID=2593676 RepID=UPI0033DA291E
MGIRMLHHRRATARPPAPADAGAVRSPSSPPAPPLSADASTARVPAAPATALRTTVTRLTRTVRRTATTVRACRDRAEAVRGHLALLLTLLPRLRPRSRPRRTVTVFVAPLTGRERPKGPAARREPGRPDAAP